MPDDEAFDKAVFEGVRGTPNNPGAVEEGDIFRDVPRAPVERLQEPVSAPVARRVIIHRSYLERFGFTEGCRKCRDILRGEESLSALGHSSACRARIEAHMEQDDVLRGRLHAAQIRQDQYLAGEVEQGASRSVPATPRGGVEEKPQEESSVEKTAVEEEDLLPEIGSGIGEEPQDEDEVAELFGDFSDEDPTEPEAKVEGAGAASSHPTYDEEGEPEPKRPRAGSSLGVVINPTQLVSGLPGNEGRGAVQNNRVLCTAAVPKFVGHHRVRSASHRVVAAHHLERHVHEDANVCLHEIGVDERCATDAANYRDHG